MLVQDVLTPAVPHVVVAVQVSHGALPDRENVVPATHAMWQTVSVVCVHAVFTPALPHAEAGAHAAHGALPDVEKVVPGLHAI